MNSKEFADKMFKPCGHNIEEICWHNNLVVANKRIAELEAKVAAYREVAIGIAARNLGLAELEQNNRVKDCWNEAEAIIDAEAQRIMEGKK